MKIIRKVTEKAAQANRANSLESTGPRTIRGKAKSRLNSTTHGLLSKFLTFTSGRDQQDYDRLHEELTRQVQPRTLLEEMVVGDIAANFWKLCRAQTWEVASVRARRKIALSVFKALTPISQDPEEEPRSPLFDEIDGSKEVFERTSAGWDCSELSVEMDHGRDNSETSHNRNASITNSLGQSEKKIRESRAVRLWQGKGSGHTSENRTTVRLGSSLDIVLRYESMLRRDLYRAINELLRLRRRRL